MTRKLKTHCNHGHPYTGNNVKWVRKLKGAKPHRLCRICHQRYVRERRARQKKFVWLQEFKCGCSQMERSRQDLTGYCNKHGDDVRRTTKLPGAGINEAELGFTS